MDNEEKSFNDFDDLKEKNEKNKIIIIVLGSVVALLVITLIVFLLLGGDKKENNNNNNGNNNGNNESGENNNNNNNNGNNENNNEGEEEEEELPRIPRTEKKMYLYFYNNNYVEDSYCDDTCMKKKGKGYVGINIEDLDARVMDMYPAGSYTAAKLPVLVLYKDGTKMKYFNVTEFKSYKLGISTEYKNYKMLVYSNSIKAIEYSNKEEHGLYSISSKKYMYKNQYDSFAALNASYVYGIKDGKKDILSLSEEKVVLDSSEGENTTLGKFVAKKVADGDSYLYTIYDSSYNIIADRIRPEYVYADGGTIYIVKNNQVISYDTNGVEGWASYAYDEVALVTKGYMIVKSGTQVMVVEYKTNTPVLAELHNGYNIEASKSGYLSKSKVTSKTGNGVYVVLDDGNDIVEYKYDPATNKVTK